MTDASNACIPLTRPERVLGFTFDNAHRAKFEDMKSPSPIASAFLAEKDRTRRVQVDERRENRQDKAHDEQAAQTKSQIKGPLPAKIERGSIGLLQQRHRPVIPDIFDRNFLTDVLVNRCY